MSMDAEKMKIGIKQLATSLVELPSRMANKAPGLDDVKEAFDMTRLLNHPVKLTKRLISNLWSYHEEIQKEAELPEEDQTRFHQLGEKIMDAIKNPFQPKEESETK